MDTYSALRHLADSWALLALVLIFLGTFAFAWRPGSRPLHEDAGRVPFRHEDRPAAPAATPAPPGATGAAAPSPRACGGDCAACACAQTPEA